MIIVKPSNNEVVRVGISLTDGLMSFKDQILWVKGIVGQ